MKKTSPLPTYKTVINYRFNSDYPSCSLRNKNLSGGAERESQQDIRGCSLGNMKTVPQELLVLNRMYNMYYVLSMAKGFLLYLKVKKKTRSCIVFTKGKSGISSLNLRDVCNPISNKRHPRRNGQVDKFTAGDVGTIVFVMSV